MVEERILITGCGGMLGEAMYRVFSQQYVHILATDIDLNEPWLKHLDVREIKECEQVFAEFKPTIVLHLAALTDLEYCEEHPENAWRTNALGTENIAIIAKKHDCTLIYISTAGIFDGEQEYFTDFDEPYPLSMYAKAKYHGEKFVERYMEKYYVFRAGWMMGSGLKKDKKFIKKIYDQIKAGKKEIFVVDDKLGTPTYTNDFASSISKVIKTGYYGLYNQVCKGSCSRYDVAIEFVRLLGIEQMVKVTKVGSDHFKKEYYAPRPYSEKLVNLKLDARGIDFMRDWKVCLQEYSAVFKKDLER